MPFPGIDNSQGARGPLTIKHNKYYQWVAFTLFFQVSRVCSFPFYTIFHFCLMQVWLRDLQESKYLYRISPNPKNIRFHVLNIELDSCLFTRTNDQSTLQLIKCQFNIAPWQGPQVMTSNDSKKFLALIFTKASSDISELLHKSCFTSSDHIPCHQNTAYTVRCTCRNMSS